MKSSYLNVIYCETSKQINSYLSEYHNNTKLEKTNSIVFSYYIKSNNFLYYSFSPFFSNQNTTELNYSFLIKKKNTNSNEITFTIDSRERKITNYGFSINLTYRDNKEKSGLSALTVLSAFSISSNSILVFDYYNSNTILEFDLILIFKKYPFLYQKIKEEFFIDSHEKKSFISGLISNISLDEVRLSNNISALNQNIVSVINHKKDKILFLYYSKASCFNTTTNDDINNDTSNKGYFDFSVINIIDKVLILDINRFDDDCYTNYSSSIDEYSIISNSEFGGYANKDNYLWEVSIETETKHNTDSKSNKVHDDSIIVYVYLLNKQDSYFSIYIVEIDLRSNDINIKRLAKTLINLSLASKLKKIISMKVKKQAFNRSDYNDNSNNNRNNINLKIIPFTVILSINYSITLNNSIEEDYLFDILILSLNIVLNQSVNAAFTYSNRRDKNSYLSNSFIFSNSNSSISFIKIIKKISSLSFNCFNKFNIKMNGNLYRNNNINSNQINPIIKESTYSNVSRNNDNKDNYFTQSYFKSINKKITQAYNNNNNSNSNIKSNNNKIITDLNIFNPNNKSLLNHRNDYSKNNFNNNNQDYKSVIKSKAKISDTSDSNNKNISYNRVIDVIIEAQSSSTIEYTFCSIIIDYCYIIIIDLMNLTVIDFTRGRKDKDYGNDYIIRNKEYLKYSNKDRLIEFILERNQTNKVFSENSNVLNLKTLLNSSKSKAIYIKMDILNSIDRTKCGKDNNTENNRKNDNNLYSSMSVLYNDSNKDRFNSDNNYNNNNNNNDNNTLCNNIYNNEQAFNNYIESNNFLLTNKEKQDRCDFYNLKNKVFQISFYLKTETSSIVGIYKEALLEKDKYSSNNLNNLYNINNLNTISNINNNISNYTTNNKAIANIINDTSSLLANHKKYNSVLISKQNNNVNNSNLTNKSNSKTKITILRRRSNRLSDIPYIPITDNSGTNKNKDNIDKFSYYSINDFISRLRKISNGLINIKKLSNVCLSNSNNDIYNNAIYYINEDIEYLFTRTITNYLHSMYSIKDDEESNGNTENKGNSNIGYLDNSLIQYLAILDQLAKIKSFFNNSRCANIGSYLTCNNSSSNYNSNNIYRSYIINTIKKDLFTIKANLKVTFKNRTTLKLKDKSMTTIPKSNKTHNNKNKKNDKISNIYFNTNSTKDTAVKHKFELLNLIDNVILYKQSYLVESNREYNDSCKSILKVLSLFSKYYNNNNDNDYCIDNIYNNSSAVVGIKTNSYYFPIIFIIKTIISNMNHLISDSNSRNNNINHDDIQEQAYDNIYNTILSQIKTCIELKLLISNTKTRVKKNLILNNKYNEVSKADKASRSEQYNNKVKSSPTLFNYLIKKLHMIIKKDKDNNKTKILIKQLFASLFETVNKNSNNSKVSNDNSNCKETKYEVFIYISLLIKNISSFNRLNKINNDISNTITTAFIDNNTTDLILNYRDINDVENNKNFIGNDFFISKTPSMIESFKLNNLSSVLNKELFLIIYKAFLLLFKRISNSILLFNSSISSKINESFYYYYSYEFIHLTNIVNFHYNSSNDVFSYHSSISNSAVEVLNDKFVFWFNSLLFKKTENTVSNILSLQNSLNIKESRGIRKIVFEVFNPSEDNNSNDKSVFSHLIDYKGSIENIANTITSNINWFTDYIKVLQNLIVMLNYFFTKNKSLINSFLIKLKSKYLQEISSNNNLKNEIYNKRERNLNKLLLLLYFSIQPLKLIRDYNNHNNKAKDNTDNSLTSFTVILNLLKLSFFKQLQNKNKEQKLINRIITTTLILLKKEANNLDLCNNSNSSPNNNEPIYNKNSPKTILEKNSFLSSLKQNQLLFEVLIFTENLNKNNSRILEEVISLLEKLTNVKTDLLLKESLQRGFFILDDNDDTKIEIDFEFMFNFFINYDDGFREFIKKEVNEIIEKDYISEIMIDNKNITDENHSIKDYKKDISEKCNLNKDLNKDIKEMNKIKDNMKVMIQREFISWYKKVNSEFNKTDINLFGLKRYLFSNESDHYKEELTNSVYSEHSRINRVIRDSRDNNLAISTLFDYTIYYKDESIHNNKGYSSLNNKKGYDDNFLVDCYYSNINDNETNYVKNKTIDKIIEKKKIKENLKIKKSNIVSNRNDSNISNKSVNTKSEITNKETTTEHNIFNIENKNSDLYNINDNTEIRKDLLEKEIINQSSHTHSHSHITDIVKLDNTFPNTNNKNNNTNLCSFNEDLDPNKKDEVLNRLRDSIFEESDYLVTRRETKKQSKNSIINIDGFDNNRFYCRNSNNYSSKETKKLETNDNNNFEKHKKNKDMEKRAISKIRYEDEVNNNYIESDSDKVVDNNNKDYKDNDSNHRYSHKTSNNYDYINKLTRTLNNSDIKKKYISTKLFLKVLGKIDTTNIIMFKNYFFINLMSKLRQYFKSKTPNYFKHNNYNQYTINTDLIRKNNNYSDYNSYISNTNTINTLYKISRKDNPLHSKPIDGMQNLIKNNYNYDNKNHISNVNSLFSNISLKKTFIKCQKPLEIKAGSNYKQKSNKKTENIEDIEGMKNIENKSFYIGLSSRRDRKKGEDINNNSNTNINNTSKENDYKETNTIANSHITFMTFENIANNNKISKDSKESKIKIDNNNKITVNCNNKEALNKNIEIDSIFNKDYKRIREVASSSYIKDTKNYLNNNSNNLRKHCITKAVDANVNINANAGIIDDLDSNYNEQQSISDKYKKINFDLEEKIKAKGFGFGHSIYHVFKERKSTDNADNIYK